MGKEKEQEAITRDEETYRILMDSLPIGVVVTTPKGLVIEANPAFIRMFGYSGKDEIRELGAVDFYIDPEDRKELLAILEKGVARYREVHLKRKDGSAFWGSFNSIAKISSSGKTLIYSALQDITERRETEDQLRMLGMAVEQTIDGVIVTDLDGKILFVNQALAVMHRFKASDLVGENMGTLHTKDQLENECDAFISELLLTGLHQAEVGRKRSDGTTFSTWTTGTLLRNKGGDAIGFVKIVHDMTEQKASEKRLKAINAELEGFVHAVTHDLKGPLSAISGASLTLQNLFGGAEAEGLGPETGKVLELIGQNVERAFSLVEDLLSLAEAGQASTIMSDVDVGEVVERILKEESRETEDKGISIEMDQDLGQVFANPTHVYQLFSNLIGNAIKHNENEKPVVIIRHLGEDDAGMNSYLVRDNGIGLNPDEIEEIFLPFYKGKGQGTGVGLAIVDKIISTYNGKIEAFNDNGACFKFSI